MTADDIAALELLVGAGMPRYDALAIVAEFARQRDELVAKFTEQFAELERRVDLVVAERDRTRELLVRAIAILESADRAGWLKAATLRAELGTVPR